MICICPHCNKHFKIDTEQREAPDSKLTKALVIVDMCCDRFSVTYKQIVGRCRKKEYVAARHIAAFLIYKWCGYSLKATGDLLSMYDHTSVIHARKKMEDALLTHSYPYHDLMDLDRICEDMINENLLQATG